MHHHKADVNTKLLAYHGEPCAGSLDLHTEDMTGVLGTHVHRMR